MDSPAVCAWTAPPSSVSAPWTSVLDAGEADAALGMARDVAARLREADRVGRAVEACRAGTAFPRSVHWRDEAVSQGYAGLALLWAAADACTLAADLDATGLEHLRLAVAALERSPSPRAGLFSGIAGVAFAAWALSRDGARYGRLLASLDGALIRLSAANARALTTAPCGVPVATFDAISGLSGVGAYLLCRVSEPAQRAALAGVLAALVAVSRVDDGLPRWHTPARELADETSRRLFPHGNANCGLAHGIAGPLALLSLAARLDVVVDGQIDAIARLAAWLVEHRIEDAWGVTWPTAVPLERGACGLSLPVSSLASGRPAPWPASRTAWCYGTPGVARALWLAGAALDVNDWRALAIDGMDAVFRRPIEARKIDAPTFCHGVAGLQQVTLRFAHDTGLPRFVDAARQLHRQIVATFEPASAVGFRNIEPGGGRLDQPGLLDGAAGVVLVLLAAATPVEPAWDRLFLLS